MEKLFLKKLRRLIAEGCSAANAGVLIQAEFGLSQGEIDELIGKLEN
jgi:hypothetical protein